MATWKIFESAPLWFPVKRIQHNMRCLVWSSNGKKRLDQSEIGGAILIDPSEANDRLPRDLIVAKLEAYGLAKESIQLTSNFLNFRKQRTQICSAFSDWANAIRGIPQGFVLGSQYFY